jgi:hypothetical protein
MKKKGLLWLCASLMLLGNAQYAWGQDVVAVDGLYYRLADGEAAVTASQEEPYSGGIVVPEEVKAGGKTYNVTQIEESAFRSSEITSIDIPKSVLKIGNYAFWDCGSLKTVVLRGYLEIGDAAFRCWYNQVLLDKIACYSSVPPKCGNDCFDCFYDYATQEKRKVTLEVPNGLADVYASSIFWYEFSVSEIDVQALQPTSETYETATRLVSYDGVWYKLSQGKDVSEAAATRLHTPSGQEGPSAYIESDKLEVPERLVLSDKLELTVTGIDENAFGGTEECTFHTLTLPASIKSIGNFAFSGCSRLKTVYCIAVTPPACTEASFEGIPKTIVVYVPKDTKEAYVQSAGWSYFDTILEIGETIPEPTSINAAPTSIHHGIHSDTPVYNLAGQEVDASYKGIVIQNGRKKLLK